MKYVQSIQFFLYVVLLFLLHCTPENKKIQPKIIAGNLDLTNKEPSNDWEFATDGVLNLDGEWEFYWEQFYQSPKIQATPDKNLNSTDKQQTNYIKIPAAWNHFSIQSSNELNKKEISGEGFATYKLVVHLKDPHGLSLKIPYINTSYKLFLNGELATSVGVVGESRESSKPALKANIIKVPESSKKLEILFHVSNFFHNKGGIRNSIRIGRDIDIQNLREKRLFFDSFLSGSLFITGLYHFGLFLLRRKDKSPLWFSIICILVSFRALLTSENYFYNLIPDFPYELGIKMEYLAFCLGTPIFILYINDIFPKDALQIFSKILQSASYALTAFLIVSPVRYFSRALILMEMLIISGMLYAFYILLRFLYNKREGAKSFAFGLLVMFFSLVNDILYSNQIIFTGYFAPLGLFIFILSQAFLLSVRSSNAFRQVEEFTEHLEQKVETRTNELLQSKQSVEKAKLKSEKLLKAIQKDLLVARNIQKAILPLRFSHPLLNVYAKYIPMTEVGGDLYHIEEIKPNYVRVFIADATGHGMQAALITMCILADYQHIKNTDLAPSEILFQVNNNFCNRYGFLSTYFTCMILDIDLTNMKINYSSAGHPTQIFYSNKKIELFYRTGRLVGLAKNTNYSLVEHPIQSGDKLFLFTDGLFEEFNPSRKEYGEEKLIQVIEENITQKVEIILEKTLADLDDFIGTNDKRDDITFLGIELN